MSHLEMSINKRVQLTQWWNMPLLSHPLPTSFFTIDFTSLTERQFSVHDWTETKYLLKILNSLVIF